MANFIECLGEIHINSSNLRARINCIHQLIVICYKISARRTRTNKTVLFINKQLTEMTLQIRIDKSFKRLSENGQN